MRMGKISTVHERFEACRTPSPILMDGDFILQFGGWKVALTECDEFSQRELNWDIDSCLIDMVIFDKFTPASLWRKTISGPKSEGRRWAYMVHSSQPT